MPDIVVHNSMGDHVLAGLDREISSLIDPDIFRFALAGSDPYLYYFFFLRKAGRGIRKRQGTMHTKKTQRYLMEMARMSQDDRMFSYLAGNLCHYALDSTTHPYINALAGKRRGYHAAIESTLGRMELSRQGRQRKELMKLLVPYPDLPEIRQVIKAVYGWDDDLFEKSYRHMKLYCWFAKDQHGLLNLLFHRLPGQYASISYANHMCDGMDLSGFEPLEKESVQMGIKFITAAYAYRCGSMDEEELKTIIGNRSYSGSTK